MIWEAKSNHVSDYTMRVEIGLNVLPIKINIWGLNVQFKIFDRSNQDCQNENKR